MIGVFLVLVWVDEVPIFLGKDASLLEVKGHFGKKIYVDGGEGLSIPGVAALKKRGFREPLVYVFFLAADGERPRNG